MYKIIGADGKEYGPVTAEVLKQWIAEGRANHLSRVLPENEVQWRLLRDLPEFSSAILQATSLPASTPAVIVAPEPRSTNPLATTGFVLALFSVTFGMCCCAGFPFNLIGAVCSGIALSQIKDNPNQEGRGLAMAGLIISILGILLGAAFFVFYALASGFAGALQSIKHM